MLTYAYSIAIVFSPNALLSDQQMAIVRCRVKGILSSLHESRIGVKIHIPLLYGMPAERVPNGLLNMKNLTNARIEFIRVSRNDVKPGALLEHLKHCDEIWCCPPTKQGRLSNSIASRLYYASQGTPHSVNFKLIPRDIDTTTEVPIEQQKKEKAKWNN